MKTTFITNVSVLAVFLLLLAPLSAQQTTPSNSPTTPASNPATEKSGSLPQSAKTDSDWEALLTAKSTAEANTASMPSEASARAEAKRARAAKHTEVADQAKNYYTAHPDDRRADEARRLEIIALVQSEIEGGDTVGGRLSKATADLRADGKVSPKIRAGGAAAFEYSRAVLGARDELGRRDAVEKSARGLVKEFPEESPGYEALLALSQAGDGGTAKAAQVAGEIAASQAPPEIRQRARILVARFGLVDKKLAEVVGSAGAELLAKLPTDQPVIVYSWATWGPGSIELGRMIQARRFAAVGICLDDDIAAAERAQHAANLGGIHVYDAKGRSGTLASALKFTTAGQIYLADAQGIIRDVLGGDDLEAKLASLGFKTPKLVKP